VRRVPCDTGRNGYAYGIPGAGTLAAEADPKLNVRGALGKAGGGALADGSPNENGVAFAAADDASGALEAGEGTCALGDSGVPADGGVSGNGAPFGVAEGSSVLVDNASGLARLFGRSRLVSRLVRFLLLGTPMLWAVSLRSSGRHFRFCRGLTPIQTAISGHVSGCVGPVMRDSASRMPLVFSRISGYRAESRGDKLESAASAMLTVFQVAMSGVEMNGVFWLYQRGQWVRHKVVLTNSSLGLKLLYYIVYILTRRLIMSRVLES
jgi:hypothetical protein